MAVDFDDAAINHGIFHIRFTADFRKDPGKAPCFAPAAVTLEHSVPFAKFGVMDKFHAFFFETLRPIAKMLIFSYRRMIMAYSPDFRKKVLETLSRGLSVRTTAALFGIHFTTIQNWKKHPEKAKTPQKRPPKKIRTEELLADIEMYPTDYLSERAKRFKCTPAAIRKAMLRNKFGAVLD